MIDNHRWRLIPSTTASLLKSTDWSGTPLGLVNTWPTALRNAVQLCLNSRFPMAIAWGDDFINLYNDGYLPIVGNKHPWAFGSKACDVYAEIWDNFLESRLNHIVRAGDVVWETDFYLPLIRDENLWEAYFTFCYSPLADDDGQWRGALSVATEVTRTVLDRRRDAVINHLVSELAMARSVREIPPLLESAMSKNSTDCQQYALVRFTDPGCIDEVMFASSPQFAERTAGLIGRFTRAVSRVDERLFAINTSGKYIDSAYGYSLLIQADPLVEPDSAFYDFLERIRKTLGDCIGRLRQDERALSERDKLYRLLFENSQDGIFLTAPDGQVFAANPSACQLLGYTEQELCNLGRDGVVFPDDQQILGALEERRRTGRFSGELRFRKKGNNTITCDVSSITFPDDQGRERSLVIFRDSTERHLAEERNQRSARLEAVGELTGGIAHDFNNLLQVMIGGTDELLKELPEDAPARPYADMVFSASLKAADLTRQLLAFGRQQSLDPAVVNVSDLVRDMDQILDRAIGEHIRVKISLEEEARVHLDPSQLQSAILNLAINAKDAMPHGGRLTIGSRTVRLDESLAREVECPPGDYAQIFVADTGIGIPGEVLSRVVEPFYTTKAKGQGTGLGLSMVFGFVRQSSGGIRILSEVDHGTRVELYFPVSLEDSPEEKVDDAPMSEDGKGETIVIVEDNELLASMLARLLERAGYVVEHYVNGEDALNRLEAASAIDLIITDVVLGAGIDGWSVANAARSLRPALPVIIMSGLAGDRETLSADLPILHKPFRAADVRELVSRMLGGS